MCRWTDTTSAALVYYSRRHVTEWGSAPFFPCLTNEKWRGMRKIVLVLSTMAAALLLVSGVALADHLVNTVYCPADEFGYCEGTEESDHMYGTDTRDYIYALGGDD